MAIPLLAGLSLAVVGAASSPRAEANLVDLKMDSVTAFDYSHYLAVTVAFNSPTVSFADNTLAGSFRTYFNSDSFNKGIHPLPLWAHLGTQAAFTTYCIDLATYLANGATRQGVDGPSSSKNVADANGVARNIAAAGWVIEHFIDLKQLGKHFPKATTTEKIATLQLAVWIAGYDPNVITTLQSVQDKNHKIIGYTTQQSSGQKTFLTFSGQAVQDSLDIKMVDWILGQRTKSSVATVGFINYPGIKPPGKGWTLDDQDQLFFVATPEPSTLLIVGLCLACGAVTTALRRRTRTSG
jgi:hypothetical protein